MNLDINSRDLAIIIHGVKRELAATRRHRHQATPHHKPRRAYTAGQCIRLLHTLNQLKPQPPNTQPQDPPCSSSSANTNSNSSSK